METYRRRQAEYKEAVAARKALKQSLGGKVPDDMLPPLPQAPRMPRRSRKPNQYNQPGPSNGGHDTSIYEDDDPDLRVHTSFRKDDDALIIDLTLAIINLTGRTISGEQCQRGEFHLRRYLRTLALVCS
jgi:hypothetical protein